MVGPFNGIDPRPRQLVEVTVDEAEEQHQIRRLVLDGGGSEREAKAAWTIARAALGIDSANGQTTYTLPGTSRPVRVETGRAAIVAEVLERARLQELGPDPAEEVERLLRLRGYTDAEIDPAMERSAPARMRDGRISFRGHYGGEQMIGTAAHRLAQELEQARRLAKVDPRVEAQVRERLPGAGTARI